MVPSQASDSIHPWLAALNDAETREDWRAYASAVDQVLRFNVPRYLRAEFLARQRAALSMADFLESCGG